MQNKETKKTVLVHKQQGPLLYIIATILLAALLISGFLFLKQRVEHTDYKTVKIGDSSYRLEVANTEVAQTKGLSERDALAPTTGMLFDFGKDGDWRMWMYRMRFNIDIAWLTKDGKIITIKHDAKPGEYPETYHAEKPSWYVIEVPAGTFADKKVNEGDTLAL